MKKILTMKKVTKTFGSGHTKVSALKPIGMKIGVIPFSALRIIIIILK